MAESGDESVDVSGPAMKSVKACRVSRCVPSGVCGTIAMSPCEAFGGVCGLSGCRVASKGRMGSEIVAFRVAGRSVFWPGRTLSNGRRSFFIDCRAALG